MANEQQVKQSEKNLVEPKTKRQVTQGKVVSLPKPYKRLAATFVNPADRRHCLNMWLDVVVSRKESALFKNRNNKVQEE